MKIIKYESIILCLLRSYDKITTFIITTIILGKLVMSLLSKTSFLSYDYIMTFVNYCINSKTKHYFYIIVV